MTPPTHILTLQLLYTSGFLFMGATEEQMVLLTSANISHTSYVLLLYSVSFLLFLFVSMLLHLYAQHAIPAKAPAVNGAVNDGAMARGVNGHVRDAEEFELEGLMSEDEEDASPGGRRKENGRAV